MMSLRSRNNLHFALGVLILAVSAAYLHFAQAKGTLLIVKGKLPLRKPLADIDRYALLPFRFVERIRLSDALVEELGTDEYLNWRVDDSGKIPPEAINVASLAITYYTGVQDQLPHVPEKCLLEGGYSLDTSDELKWNLPLLGRQVVLRRSSFFSPRDPRLKMYIYYTLSVNGDFYTTRNTARFRIVDPSETHLYYSKIEVGFQTTEWVPVGEFDRRAFVLLDRTLSELVRSHWPPAESARGGRTKETASGR